MRRILLATTAITALALATPMALAQSSSGPNGALEEQKTAAGQKQQDRDSDDAQSWDAQWIARGSERSGPRSHAEREAPDRSSSADRAQCATAQGPADQSGSAGAADSATAEGAGAAERPGPAADARHGRRVQQRAAVPRSVRVYTLPPEIVEVVPEYRGYDYVLVGEDIVIIDPESHEIVAVIPA